MAIIFSDKFSRIYIHRPTHSTGSGTELTEAVQWMILSRPIWLYYWPLFPPCLPWNHAIADTLRGACASA